LPARARRRGEPKLVTLSSDLGSAYAAQLKAVLLSELPGVRIVDLTHELRPHAIAEAAFVLLPAIARFPKGAVHVVVVDPGVGGSRQAVAVACRDGSVLVGPDNGVLPALAEARGGGIAHRIEKLARRPRVGTTFDGRDVFAPAAAELAAGTPPGELGPRTRLARLAGPRPSRTPDGARGSVAHVDRFGNVLTDVPASWAPEGSSWLRVRLGRGERRLSRQTSYEAAGPGRLFALGSSFGTLELAVAMGRAVDRLRAHVGQRVRFVWEPARPRLPRRNRK
jgi:S-adenosyl-L-methionine hydrolase (adenosine-forming)